MMTNRKLSALRALAERPGTEHEGVLARELLARFEKYEEPPDSIWKIWDDFEAGRVSKDGMLERIVANVRAGQNKPFPNYWNCACRAIIPTLEKCHNVAAHEAIQQEIRRRFKKGDRVYYSHCCDQNSPATVQGYVKPGPPNNDHPWAWIRLRLDRLKTPRNVPIISAKGWHLSHEPLPPDEARKMGRP